MDNISQEVRELLAAEVDNVAATMIRNKEHVTVSSGAALRAIDKALQQARPGPAVQPEHRLSPVDEIYPSDDWLAQGYKSAAEEINDMADVGRSLMERIANATKPGGGLEGWSPMDDPAEVVDDLLNRLDEAGHGAAASASDGSGNKCATCGGTRMIRWLGRDNSEEVSDCPDCGRGESE